MTKETKVRTHKTRWIPELKLKVAVPVDATKEEEAKIVQEAIDFVNNDIQLVEQRAYHATLRENFNQRLADVRQRVSKVREGKNNPTEAGK